MNVHQNPNDLFWLARYAHNTLAPLIEVAKQYEPSIHLKIEMEFTEGHKVYQGNSLGIMGHWVRTDMFMYRPFSTTKDDVDRAAKFIREWIDTEQAELEAREDAAAEAQAATEAEADRNAAEARADLEVFYGMEEARQAEEDAAWDLEQERIRERADIDLPLIDTSKYGN